MASAMEARETTNETPIISIELNGLKERVLGINPLGQINSGGIGANEKLSSLPPDTFIPGSERYAFEQQLTPSGKKSLSGIAVRSNLLGFVFASSLWILFYLLALAPTLTPFWRIPFFLSILSNFHFLEFYLTAYANTPEAQVSTFLLTSNGLPYAVAHGSAFLECVITNLFFPDRHWIPNFLSNTLVFVGLVLVVVGQGIRSVAMWQAGRSFTHLVQSEKRAEHVLITHGVYSYLRHPSYFGFYWWGLGSQLVLGNPFAFVGYAIVLHRFFEKRIKAEETKLIKFFGNDYIQYRAKTPVGIPLIQ